MDRPASRLVVGAAQFGQSYGRSGKPAPTDAEVADILRLAVELECAAVDTARAYGDSEAAIGRARRSGAGGALPVVTKIRPLTDHSETLGIETAVRASLTESLSHVGAFHLDAVLLHRTADLRRAGGAAIHALRAARAHGLLGRWGVSVADPDELAEALAVPDLGYIQLPFNVVDRRWLTASVQDALAARPDVTIVARSAFLQGILLDPDDATWPRDARPDAAAVRASLARMAAETGRTFAGLCLGYALAQPWIDAVVVGIRSRAQLAHIADEFARGSLPESDCRRLEASIPAGSPDLVSPALWPPRREDST
ncbi:aldo/keto reductase [Pseudolysinimonas kribbensis]|uniref:Oxidoreductase n=1 Tax=Pseudolysinimonas kribbensis TaxID=433641 RepID=A0ABQ6K726_9MICO|nr:aldo/keto reductase [Pseudolysinimonas kribbensis]GMA94780.1 oxidoreductase [Pseudolysinimonas kribbensis]